MSATVSGSAIFSLSSASSRPTASEGLTVLPRPTETTLMPTTTPTEGSDQNIGNRPIAASAALYLYTFLATLVLLLTVSAAIVIRSYILRRRHRRLVEEAIRNGTWVPPPPPSSTRTPRVDLSKKPVMWEAYLGGGNEKDGYPGSMSQDEVKDWDAIKPVSAAYLAPRPTPNSSGNTKASESTTPTRPRRSATTVLVSGLRAIPRYGWMTLRVLGGYPPRSRRVADASAAQNGASDASGTATLGRLENPPSIGPDGGPPVVRVAVIIAMPNPPKSAVSTPNTSPDSHPLSDQQRVTPLRPPDWDDEEPLPVMEMGVTELVVTGADKQDGSSNMHVKAPLGRDSASLRSVEEV